MTKPPQAANEPDQGEADRKRDEALLRALKMPHKPHAALKRDKTKKDTGRHPVSGK